MTAGNGRLDQATLDACTSRAAGYDHDNRFFLLCHEIVGKTALIDLGEQPRWG